MNVAKVFLSILMSCVPPFAHAQAFKCQSADGRIAFQDHPCDKGAASSNVTLRPTPKVGTIDPRRPPGASTATPSAARNPQYPYARGDDVERLRKENDELQAMNARMKADNPNWQHSQTLTRLNAQAEALNARIRDRK